MEYICNMIYYVIGTMSGSSMDGLDIVYTKFEEKGGKWNYEILQFDCIPFSNEWTKKLLHITDISAKELIKTHVDFGHWMGNEIKNFIDKHHLHHKVHLIASHGHTVFHEPELHYTFQMGDGAAIAAINKLPVVCELRNMDIALGGQGAPIVPIGEKLLWNEYEYFLNIGGIANISFAENEQHIAFDICAANRVLNLLSNELGMAYDANGAEANKGKLNEDLLYELNDLDYYKKSFPKSLSNEFGVNEVYQIIQKYSINVGDKLNTYCHHIAQQVAKVCIKDSMETKQMLVSGGGAFNTFLMSCLKEKLAKNNIEIIFPTDELIQYKEALIMGLIGVLRWREQHNVLHSVTGASSSSVGGALWMGQE